MSLFRFRLRCALAGCALAAAPLTAHAWWSGDYKQRTRITLNTSAAGVATGEALTGVAVPVRLHSANFDFLGAKPDGADLHVVAGDDKTPLKFQIERFDGSNELAVLWVQWPTVAPGTDKNQIYVYAGNDKASAEPAAAVADAGSAATFRFSQADGVVRDLSGELVAAAPIAVEPNGLIGSSARFDGDKTLTLPANDRMKAAAGAAYSIGLWARPAVLGGTLFAQGPLSLTLDGAKLVVRLGRLQFAGGDLPPSAWVHVGLTLGAGKATLYVDGVQAAQADLPANAPPVEGALRIGQGYSGLLDELQIATTLRSAEWMKFTRAAQGADAKLVASDMQRPEQAADGDSGHGGYIRVLVKNLTVDVWVVIIILRPDRSERYKLDALQVDVNVRF